MVPRQFLWSLLVLLFLLPVAAMLLFLFARLFIGIGNPTAGAALDWSAFAVALLWVLDFIAIVIALALRAVEHDDPK